MIDFEKGNGLVPAVVQDAETKEVLMVGYMNRESFGLTKETGLVTFWSRSRSEIWVKGKTSGNFLHLKELRLDCDGDAILVLAEPAGPVCHTGAINCFMMLDGFPGTFAWELEAELDPILYPAQLAQKGS